MVKKMPIIISTLTLLGGLAPVSSCFADTLDYDEVYNSGYNNGTIDGYWEGYENGRANGYNEGYRDGYNFGLNSGYEEGYSNGHSNGYNDGYNNGYNDAAIDDRYDIGYGDGLNSGLNEGYANGHNDGYQAGYQDGYSSGVSTIYQEEEENNMRGIMTVGTDDVVNTNGATAEPDNTIDNTIVATLDNISERSTEDSTVAIASTNVTKPTTNTITAPDTGAPTEENHSSEFPWWAFTTVLISGFLVMWWLMPIKKSKKSKKF